MLLTSKFFRPTLPPQQVARKHLVARLETGLSADHALLLISAPAGYGKSTLAAEWLSFKDEKGSPPVLQSAWLSLEEADDDPLRFFTYFVTALQRADTEIGVELAQTLAAGQLPPQQVIVATLVNDLVDTRQPTLIVLDDFQWIQNPTILAVLQELLTHRPPRFHLVILTREDPALPLTRWRAKNRLTEIRAADLRFGPEETEQFLREGMELKLSDEDLVRLLERTEGWAAGLQLAAVAMKSPLTSGLREDAASFVRSLSGSHRFILSYLTEEVLKRQPPEVQDFLLATSILTTLNGELCDALTGRSDSTALLESLLSANLFLIPLDPVGRWYRYHHLFADLLQTQLHRLHPERVADLHRRASDWFEAANLPVEALRHAFAAEDFKRAMALLEVHLWQLLSEGYVRPVESWMEALPAGQSISPRVDLGLAWLYLLRGNFEQVLNHWRRAATALAEEPAPSPLRAESLALQANLLQSQGRVNEALDAAQDALDGVGPNHSRVAGLAYLARGGAHRQAGNFSPALKALQHAVRLSQEAADPVTAMLAVSHLTLMSLPYGRLRSAAETAAQAISWLQRSNSAPPPIVGSVYAALGVVHYEWNEIEKARAHFERGIKRGSFSGHNASVIYAKIHLARLLQAEGEYVAAEQEISDATALVRQGAPDWVRPDLLARQANLLVAQSRLDEAERVLHTSGVALETAVTHRTDALHLAWLRLLSARRSPKAGGLARRIVRAAEAGERNGTLLEALVLGALLETEDARTRREWLTRALVLAEPEGYLRLFVDEGAPLAALLRQVEVTPYVERLLRHFPADSGDKQRTPEALIEPLSERELEVLDLLGEGLTYGEIAERLIVSINTVRYHIKGIYGKLGVNRQAHAVERARELGLLSNRPT
ncbi:MAG: LuxR C-terminal-related transcriptional regulator [Anaerolineales bacterium]